MSDNQSNVGIKIAKPFFNVNEAGDTDLILNSSWPTLQIAFEKTVPINRSAGFPYTFTATVDHNLGFPPFFSVWAIYRDSVSRLVSIEKFTGALTNFSTSSTTATISGAGDDNTFNMTHIHFKFYNVDLSKDVDYPFINLPTDQVLIDDDFGIKLVKEGKSLDSQDMRGFILHSRCQSPLVLAVKTEKSGITNPTGGTLAYKNPYPGLVWVFGYVKSGGLYRLSPYLSQAYPITTIDAATNTFRISWANAANDNGATLLVLRDPFFSGNDLQASY